MLDQALLEGLPAPLAETYGKTVATIDRLCQQLTHIVANNQALLSPIGDWQAIDIGLAFTLLACRPGAHSAIDGGAEELAERSIFAFQVHGRYPVTSRSYWDLIDHPTERSEDYRQSATEGSILYPLLAFWAAARGKQNVFDAIAAFKTKSLGHCTFQTWLPDEDTEDNLYLGRNDHGAALTGIPVSASTQDTLDFVMAEVASNPHYDALSAVRLGHWPIVLTACRTHRLPVPPQVWRDLLPSVRAPAASAVPPSDAATATSPEAARKDVAR